MKNTKSQNQPNTAQSPTSRLWYLQPSWSPLIFPLLFAVEEFYSTPYLSGSFFLIYLGSGFRCLRGFSFLTYPITYHDALQAKWTPSTNQEMPIMHTVAKYHDYYQTLIKNETANGAASNVFTTAYYVPVKTKCIIMKNRTGTLYNQKHAVWFKHLISLSCPLCPQIDSSLHILSGCQHTQIKNMITERHNLACSMIFKAISKTGFLGSCFVCIYR